MKLGIINSAFGQAGVDTEFGLQHIARIGFDCVDIFTEAMTITSEEKRLVLDTCRKNSLPIVSLPVVAAGLIDFNQPVRAFHVERCQAFIDLAAEWGAGRGCDPIRRGAVVDLLPGVDGRRGGGGRASGR